MTTKCLIVDDEPLAIELIRRHIQQVKKLEIVATCQNPMDAFALLQKEAIDLIFLDIQMPMLTGVEFLKSLPHPRPSSLPRPTATTPSKPTSST